MKIILTTFLLTGSIYNPFSFAQKQTTFKPVMQVGHKSAIKFIIPHPNAPIVLTGDGITTKLWNFNSGDMLQTFNVNFATFNKDGQILTLKTIGEDESQAEIIDFNTLKIIKSTKIPAEFEKIYWNSDSTALLINSGRWNFSERSNTIIDPQTLKTITSFKAYNVIANEDEIIVVNYNGTHSYNCSKMDYNGKIIWKRKLSHKAISCCGSTNFQFLNNYIVFSEFSYFLNKKINHTEFFQMSDGNSKGNKKELQKQMEILEDFTSIYNFNGKWYGKANRFYSTETYILQIENGIPADTIYTDENISEYSISRDNSKLFIGYNDGHINVYSLENKKTIFESGKELTMVSEISNACILDRQLYLFTQKNKAFILNLDNLSFKESEAKFNHFDQIIVINDSLKKGLFYSENYYKGETTINKTNTFTVFEKGKFNVLSGRPMCTDPSKRMFLIDRINELVLLDIATMEEKKLNVKLKPNKLKYARFSPDGNYIAFVNHTLLQLINTKNQEIIQKEIQADTNQIASYQAPGFKEERFEAFQEIRLFWEEDSESFHLALGSPFLWIYRGNLNLKLNELPFGSKTGDGLYFISFNDKKISLKPTTENGKVIEHTYKDKIHSCEELMPGKILVIFENKINIVSIPDFTSKELKIPNFNYYSGDKFKCLTSNNDHFIRRITDNNVEIYNLNTGEFIGDHHFQKGNYSSINFSNSEFSFFYDYIFEGITFKLNNFTKEFKEYPAGELPVYGSSNFVGEYLGDFSDLTKDYSHTRHIKSANYDNVDLNNDESYFFTINNNGELNIYNKDTDKNLATIYLVDDQFFLLTPENYYTKSSEFSNLKFAKNQKLYSFEQFDLKYNRPDIVLDKIGGAKQETISLFKLAYEKRLKKMGFKEEMLSDDFHLPELKIENFEDLPIFTDSSSIQLNLNIKDSKYKLDRINLWINDVAIYGNNGISLKNDNLSECKKEIQVRLAKGKNKIQVSVLNSAGSESFKETFEINCSFGKEKSDLYLITIGESEFIQSNYNLNYAAKDAQDISKLFVNDNLHQNVYIKTLINNEAILSNILELKKTLAKADINDEVILFFAGHGILDKNLDYFLSTYDIDFENPSKNGLAYTQLESILEGIKPLKKTLILDACHSGEIDKEEVDMVAENMVINEKIKFRSVGNKTSTRLESKNVTELTKTIFSDLRKGNGATVISSSGGMEFAIESESWNNGLFTYCFINGIKTMEADLNHDQQIWLSELKEYISSQVIKLSNGMQQPTSRIENHILDFRIR